MRRHHTNVELEAEIARDPDDAAPYLVYADWLQAQGDLRGELIVVQHALAAAPKSKSLRERESALLGREARHFYGALVGVDDSVLSVRWRRGFLSTAYVIGDRRDPDRRCSLLLERLLSHPSARFLQHLHVTHPLSDDHRAVLAAIESARRPFDTLRTLAFGDQRQRAPTSAPIGSFDWAFWQRFPSLRRLFVQGAPESLGQMDLPRVEELTLRCSVLSAQTVRMLGEASWPALERLEIWLPSGAGVEPLRALLSGDRTPRLRHLSILGAHFVDALCHALPRAPLLPRLATLDVSGSMLHAHSGVASLVRHPEPFAHLEQLRLSCEDIDDATRWRLRNLCGDVVIEGRQYHDLE